MIGKHVLWWVSVSVIALVATPLLSHPEDVTARIKREIGFYESHLGEDSAKRVLALANKPFEAIFVDTGMMAKFANAYSGRVDAELEKAARAWRKTGDLTNHYMYTLLLVVYSLFVRAALILSWLPFALPFIIAAAADGYFIRSRKNYSFEFINPVTYSAAVHSLVLIAFGPVFFMLTPFAITPLVVPVILLMCGVALHVFARNMQRISL